MMAWPILPARAAYLAINNSKRRNALSLAVLRDLKEQLIRHNTSPVDGRLRILPHFKASILDDLEKISEGKASGETTPDLAWLIDGEIWRREREGLPSVIVLRSEGPVFSSGHDLRELSQLSHADVKTTFEICAEVMSLIRRSPAPVVGVIQGLATAAGCQLALTTDLPIAAADTKLQLPGASIGLPCTSPSSAVSRKLGASLTYRMLALAEPIRAADLPPGTIEIVPDTESLERRVQEVVEKLADQSGAQSQALGKWAFWTQAGLRGSESSGDGYEEAVTWAGRMMALHARSDDAKEGIKAFFEKRKPMFKL
ncbi:Enoyl-CoA hydratase domain-containing protein 3, mitochondrial [Pseudocercospora fuligena]|uniref:Enoyl-CoA hydratase domain-containing protein 3, mitochondrial n=1 Tax=Pseudocercospora fuligena TaxID=685502 RepID=A0A8H6RRE5_9PEZI|nr:Enoyl-CoA hydratase domain-containing protein 3, mitochondrial [Pseudocercospora fuligena]